MKASIVSNVYNILKSLYQLTRTQSKRIKELESRLQIVEKENTYLRQWQFTDADVREREQYKDRIESLKEMLRKSNEQLKLLYNLKLKDEVKITTIKQSTQILNIQKQSRLFRKNTKVVEANTYY